MCLFIKVHYKEHGVAGIVTRSLTRRGTDPRIIVQSFEYIKVIFIAGSNEYDHVKRPYLGFHADYEYVSGGCYFENINTVHTSFH